MPCVTETDNESLIKAETELNKTTDMLCWVLSRLQSRGWIRRDIQDWWAKHQEWDKKRQQEEKQYELQSIRDLEFGIKEKAEELAALKKKHGVK